METYVVYSDAIFVNYRIWSAQILWNSQSKGTTLGEPPFWILEIQNVDKYNRIEENLWSQELLYIRLYSLLKFKGHAKYTQCLHFTLEVSKWCHVFTVRFMW